jgi:hypothetical protein
MGAARSHSGRFFLRRNDLKREGDFVLEVNEKKRHSRALTGGRALRRLSPALMALTVVNTEE